MGLDNNTHPALHGSDDDAGKRNLGVRMQVQLRLLDKYQLVGFSSMKGHENRQYLGGSESNISEADEILGAAYTRLLQPPHLQLERDVGTSLNSNLPCDT